MKKRLYIKRKRYVIVRNNKDIFCGLSRDYKFKPVNELGNTPIKTYLSEKKAWSSFLSSWHPASKEWCKDTFEVVPIDEEILSDTYCLVCDPELKYPEYEQMEIEDGHE